MKLIKLLAFNIIMSDFGTDNSKKCNINKLLHDYGANKQIKK